MYTFLAKDLHRYNRLYQRTASDVCTWTWFHSATYWGLPRWFSGIEYACQCREHRRRGFDPWVEKILWNMCVVSPSITSSSFDPMNCRLPGSSIHRIIKARILEWVTVSFSWGSSQPNDWTHIFDIAGRFFLLLSHRGRPHPLRRWQPTPVFLPGKSQGQRSLVG